MTGLQMELRAAAMSVEWLYGRNHSNRAGYVCSGRCGQIAQWRKFRVDLALARYAVSNMPVGWRLLRVAIRDHET